LALWKIINDEEAILIPKESRRKIFQGIFALGRAKDLSAALYIIFDIKSDISFTLFCTQFYPGGGDNRFLENVDEFIQDHVASHS
jgi:hypothetical protein